MKSIHPALPAPVLLFFYPCPSQSQIGDKSKVKKVEDEPGAEETFLRGVSKVPNTPPTKHADEPQTQAQTKAGQIRQKTQETPCLWTLGIQSRAYIPKKLSTNLSVFPGQMPHLH
jgi:hypothetical protein